MQIAEKDGIPHISRHLIDEGETLTILRPVIVDGKFEPGLSLDILRVGDVSSFFFRANGGLESRQFKPFQRRHRPQPEALWAI